MEINNCSRDEMFAFKWHDVPGNRNDVIRKSGIEAAECIFNKWENIVKYCTELSGRQNDDNFANTVRSMQRG